MGAVKRRRRKGTKKGKGPVSRLDMLPPPPTQKALLGFASGDPPMYHDWYDTTRRWKDHVGMTYEVWQCRRCAGVARHYPGSHWTCMSPPCIPGKYEKKGKVKRRHRRGSKD